MAFLASPAERAGCAGALSPPREQVNEAVRIVGAGVISAAGRGEDAFFAALLAKVPGQAPHSVGDARFGEPAYAAITADRTSGDADLASHWLGLVCDDA